MNDPRAAVIPAILDTIDKVRPNIFILEQVESFRTRYRALFRCVLKFLRAISDSLGRQIYTVQFRIVDSFHYGLPQRRRRLYIVGLKKMKMASDLGFAWPLEMPPVLSMISCVHHGMQLQLCCHKLQLPYKGCSRFMRGWNRITSIILLTRCFWTHIHQHIGAKTLSLDVAQL